MLDARDAAPLPDSLDQLADSGLSALASLANALREDQPAVVQAVLIGQSPAATPPC
ncbi:hypothetical protein AB0D86_44445 [Streptomyces sp. NPDC048324]|uniref:hypothetical protein n=1 Tax=Streptomyces sp. NPDC048324 TaxID=3157205 RepID=UPI0034259004